MFAERFNELTGKNIKKYIEPLGVSDVTIWLWKSGKSEPKAHNIVAICKYFNVSADWLLGLSDE